MKEFSFKVEEKFNNYKVIDFLKAQGVSKEIILKVKFGGVKLNQITLSNINEKVKTGDVITIILPPDKVNEPVAPFSKLIITVWWSTLPSRSQSQTHFP